MAQHSDAGNGGASFKNGRYAFWPSGQNRGAFERKGNLEDAGDGDGHNVCVQVRVEGYGWRRCNGKQKDTVHFDR